jgi:outer membrane protein TolC
MNREVSVKKVILSLAVALLVVSDGSAEELQVSLKEAVRMALSDNRRVKASQHEQQAALSTVSASRSRYFPRIFLEENVTASNMPTRVFMMKLDQGRFKETDFAINSLNDPSSTTDFRTAATLEMPILDFTIGSTVEMAKNDAAAAAFAFDRQREEVAFQVFASYLEVQKAKAFVAVSDRQVEDAEEHLRLSEVRHREGIGLKSDLLRAKTFLAEMEQQNISACHNLRLAKMRLALATGRRGGMLDAADEVPVPAVRYDVEQLIELAESNRQDLKQAEMGAERANHAVSFAKKAYLPTLYGSASYQMNDRDVPLGHDHDSWIAGGVLRWELFDGMRKRNERLRAEALKESSEEYVEEYREEVAFQVTESYLRREEAEKRLEMSRRAVTEAEEGLRLVNTRYENSISTMMELLDAQTALNRANANLVENEAAFALASARLYHMAGLFLKEVMQ